MIVYNLIPFPSGNTGTSNRSRKRNICLYSPYIYLLAGKNDSLVSFDYNTPEFS